MNVDIAGREDFAEKICGVLTTCAKRRRPSWGRRRIYGIIFGGSSRAVHYSSLGFVSISVTS